jgi:hypothetical protein
MSSDNPYEQVEALIASDERQRLPESVDAILRAIAKVPGAGPLIAAVRYESEKQRIENSRLMLETAWEELKRVSAIVDVIQKNPARREEVRRLILDATRKAEDLRDVRRVERIGKILAHAITLGSNFNKAEEMMRVARDLSDQDVIGLGHLYHTQFPALEKTGWQIDVDATNKIWREHPLKIPGTTLPGEKDSILLKLQGLGLAATVERRDTQHGPNERVFALLPKGADFVHYIRGAVSSTATSPPSDKVQA